MPNIRLFIEANITHGAIIKLSDKQAHYLCHVMRQKNGDKVIIFNNADGEWEAYLENCTRQHAFIAVKELIRAPINRANKISLAFAPVKNYSANLIVQKITELGVVEIYPIITERTVVKNINAEKLRIAAIEAAEQSERIDLPIIHSINSLRKVLEIHKDSTIIFCDEEENQNHIIDVIYKKKYDSVILLIGPEGGFTESERLLIKSFESSFGVTLNPYILRSETAAIAALAILQASVL